MSKLGPGKQIAVVGGGLAGLTAAYELTSGAGQSITLFEASERLGGTIETVHADGFTIECGPDSWVSDRPAARELAVELGLEAELIACNEPERKTYLARGHELAPMPTGMRMMVPTLWEPILQSPLFSPQARLEYLREPGRADELKAEARSRPKDFDESVAAFVTRHFGEEATRTIAGPLLAGIFGGDIQTLSAGSVLAPFVRMEREHGSLIAPMRARAQAERQAGKEPLPLFTTVRSGLGTLIRSLAGALPADSVRCSSPVRAIRRVGEAWQVESNAPEPETFDAVVLATPAHETRALLAPLQPEAGELLRMEATSSIVVALCFSPEASLNLQIPEGFGFLALQETQSETPELLAGTFMHRKFPSRAPEGGIFLRGFFGDAAGQALMNQNDGKIAEAARAGFARYLGPLPLPTHAVVRRWPHSLPQYSVGHPERMRRLAACMKQVPGLVLTGNAYCGVGLPAVIEHARRSSCELNRELNAKG